MFTESAEKAPVLRNIVTACLRPKCGKPECNVVLPPYSEETASKDGISAFKTPFFFLKAHYQATKKKKERESEFWLLSLYPPARAGWPSYGENTLLQQRQPAQGKQAAELFLKCKARKTVRSTHVPVIKMNLFFSLKK